MIDAAEGKLTGRIRLAGRVSGQQRDALVDGRNSKDTEAAGTARIDDILAQHQVRDVGGRNENSLVVGKAAGLADVEEALDLLVDAADGLHPALLIHRAGHRQRLLDRDLR